MPCGPDEAGLIADGASAGVWMEMIQRRNLTAHTYDAETATAVIQMVCIQEFDRLHATRDPHQQQEDPS